MNEHRFWSFCTIHTPCNDDECEAREDFVPAIELATVVAERDRLEARISARHTRALEAEKEVARLRFEVAGLKHLVEAHLRSSVDAVSADDALRAAYVAFSANRAPPEGEPDDELPELDGSTAAEADREPAGEEITNRASPEETRCPACKGHGDIWTSWGGTRPVQCGHCNGTGIVKDTDPAQALDRGERE